MRDFNREKNDHENGMPSSKILAIENYENGTTMVFKFWLSKTKQQFAYQQFVTVILCDIHMTILCVND